MVAHTYAARFFAKHVPPAFLLLNKTVPFFQHRRHKEAHVRRQPRQDYAGEGNRVFKRGHDVSWHNLLPFFCSILMIPLVLLSFPAPHVNSVSCFLTIRQLNLKHLTFI